MTDWWSEMGKGEGQTASEPPPVATDWWSEVGGGAPQQPPADQGQPFYTRIPQAIAGAAGDIASHTGDWFTGSLPVEYPDAPELGTSGPDVAPFSAAGMQMFIATATANEEGTATVATKALPGATTSQDKHGNWMVEWKGTNYYVNKPNPSEADFFRLFADIAQYTPAAKAVTTIGNIWVRVLAMGGAMGATSVAQDLAGQAVGSEQPIDPVKALMMATGGMVFEGITPVARSIWGRAKGWRQSFSGPDGTLSPEGAAVLDQVGIDPRLATPQVIRELNELNRRVGGQATREAQAAIEQRPMTPGYAEDVAGVANREAGAEFGLRYTTGEATGSASQLGAEEAMRSGARGEGPLGQVRRFDLERGLYEPTPSEIVALKPHQRDMHAGANVAAERLSPTGEAMASGITETGLPGPIGVAGSIAASGRRQMAQAAQGVDDAYKAFRAYGGDMATVTGERLRTLVGYMKAALRLSDRDVAADVSPRTIAALRYFIRQTGAVATRGHQITRMNLRRLEQLRRRLGSYIDAAKKEGGPDYGNLTVMKKAFDDWVSDTLDDGFFSGNAKALDAIKFARDKNTEFWKTWKARDLERDAQTTWEKILNENYTSKEVADWIYGTTSLGESGRPVRLIKHIKDVFGEASNEWQTLRQGVFIRAFYGTARDPMKVGPQKAASNLGQALSDAAAPYMNELFSPAELALMRRLQTGIQRFVPPRQMTNRSGSAWTGARELMALWDKLKMSLPFIAAGSGDPFVAGAIVAGAAGSVARKTATNRAATAAVRGYILPPYSHRSFGAAGAAGGGQVDR